LPRWWRKAIRQSDPQLHLWNVGDVGTPPFQSSDPLILEWCEANDAYLLTNNRKSMPRHLADHIASGRHVPGISIVDPLEALDRVVLDLSLIGGASLPEEYQDQIRYLPIV
jgi:hypothetical protein